MSKALKKKGVLEIARTLPATGKPPKYRLEDGGEARLSGDTKEARAANLRDTLAACGTDDYDLSKLLMTQLANVLPQKHVENVDAFNGALAMLHGIRPTCELEGMLACQMVAAHILAMEAGRRSMLAGQSVEGL